MTILSFIRTSTPSPAGTSKIGYKQLVYEGMKHRIGERFELAFNCFEKAHQLDPKSYIPLHNMGILLKLHATKVGGDSTLFNRAITCLKDAIKAQPLNSVKSDVVDVTMACADHYHLSALLIQKKAYREAIPVIADGLVLAEMCAQIPISANFTQERTEQVRNTLMEMRQRALGCKHLEEERANAFSKGGVHFAKEEWKEALEAFNKAHQTRPDQLTSHYLAVCCERFNAIDDTIRYLQDAMRFYEESPLAEKNHKIFFHDSYALANLLANRKLWKEASTYYTQALRVLPHADLTELELADEILQKIMKCVISLDANQKPTLEIPAHNTRSGSRNQKEENKESKTKSEQLKFVAYDSPRLKQTAISVASLLHADVKKTFVKKKPLTKEEVEKQRAELLAQGDKFFEKSNWKEALNFYQLANGLRMDQIACHNMAVCFSNLGLIDNAMACFEVANQCFATNVPTQHACCMYYFDSLKLANYYFESKAYKHAQGIFKTLLATELFKSLPQYFQSFEEQMKEKLQQCEQFLAQGQKSGKDEKP